MENSRFKFRVWDETRKKYWGKEEWDEKTKRYYDDNYVYLGTDGRLREYHFGDVCLFDKPGQIVEQCTGLSDKNEKLIYEGDIVEITIFGSVGPNGGYVDSDEIYKGTVVWVRDCFLVKTDTDMILFPHSEDCIEIIGNIHKQAEQKGNK